MTKKLFFVEVTKSAWVLAESSEEAKEFADEILDTEYLKELGVSLYTEENLRASGWDKNCLVYHNGTNDITIGDALK
jgi:hypothetical protein